MESSSIGVAPTDALGIASSGSCSAGEASPCSPSIGEASPFLPSARASSIGVAPGVASTGVDFAGVASSNGSNSVCESETSGHSVTMTTPLFVFRLFS